MYEHSAYIQMNDEINKHNLPFTINKYCSQTLQLINNRFTIERNQGDGE